MHYPESPKVNTHTHTHTHFIISTVGNILTKGIEMILSMSGTVN